MPFFLHYAQQIASGLADSHPGANVTFGLADYFATLDYLDDGDGSEFHPDVANFSSASTFGSAVNSTFGSIVVPNGTYADSDMNDSLLHSSSITALFGALASGEIHWSPSAHHVVVLVGSTGPRDPAYVENYSVSASVHTENPPPSGLLSPTCEPSFNFAGGSSPTCEGWAQSQDGNASHSIAALTSDGSSCVSSLGGTCTIDTIDLWATPTDPASPGWPSQFASIGGGPNGSVVETNVRHVLAAGCAMANATGGSWDGPDFYPCMGQNGTLNFTGINSTFDESSRLYQALLDVGFGNPPVTPTYSVTFHESGLPTGTEWTVAVNGSSQSASTEQLSFDERNGTYSYSVGAVSGYVASPYSGSITVSGTNESVSVVFTPVRFDVTFMEAGLPVGFNWSVSLGDQSQHST